MKLFPSELLEKNKLDSMIFSKLENTTGTKEDAELLIKTFLSNATEQIFVFLQMIYATPPKPYL